MKKQIRISLLMSLLGIIGLSYVLPVNALPTYEGKITDLAVGKTVTIQCSYFAVEGVGAVYPKLEGDVEENSNYKIKFLKYSVNKKGGNVVTFSITNIGDEKKYGRYYLKTEYWPGPKAFAPSCKMMKPLKKGPHKSNNSSAKH